VQFRPLGRTGLSVSRVCLGTMTFGSQVDRNEAQRMVDLSLASGVNFFDTANVYNQGESERILGRAIAGRRAEIVLAGKVGGRMTADGTADGYEGLSRQAIFRAVDASLERLATDYLDLYYLHHPDCSVPIEESLEALERLVEAGKIRFPALSNFASWQATEALWIAAGRKYTPATVSQPMYNLLARGVEQEYLPMCRRFGIFTCIYNPLAGGLLTGKQTESSPVAGTRFDNNRTYLDRYWHPAYFEAVRELSGAAALHGRSLASVALNWLWHHTDAGCIIMGASRPGQLRQNLAALEDGPLPPGLLGTCETVWNRLRGATPKYNR
jgi:1-deoxyxylulose-5-phosphate synthase